MTLPKTPRETSEAPRKHLSRENHADEASPRLCAKVIDECVASPRSAGAAQHVESSLIMPHLLPLEFERVDSSLRYLNLLHVLEICERLRESLCKHCGDHGSDEPAGIRKRANGRGSNKSNVRFIPLAVVGHSCADGRLLGMALALPHRVAPERRHCISTALERIRKDGLKLGRCGSWRIQPITSRRPSHNLLPETWTGQPQGATDWATVTPIALDHHVEATDPATRRKETDAMIRLACRQAGLPEPCEVIDTVVSAHFGVPPARAFPSFREQGHARRHCHAILTFAEPVRGPILLGAGRHCGYGLCRPMLDEA